MAQRVLIVGAGAVGCVFGRHLALAGWEVTFYVREAYAAEVARGFDLCYLNERAGDEAPEHFDGHRVLTRFDEVAEQRWDCVYVTVSSAALRGPWLRELAGATGDATIVALQPGRDDRETLLRGGVAGERLVMGMISFISYPAPLPGEVGFAAPCTAYWFPPLAPSPFSGSADRTAAVVAALKKGRLPAKRVKDVSADVAFPSAVIMPYLLALEAAGWSFAALRADGGMALGERAAREALAVVAGERGAPIVMRLLANRAVLSLVVWVAARATPFPLEAYVRMHFTKVRDQTSLFVSNYISQGKQGRSDTATLEKLLASAEGRREPRALAGPSATGGSR